MKILFAMSTGICGFAARQPFTTLADLKGKKIGGFPNYAALTEMGYNVISVDVSQVYESLKNGVIDAMTLTLVPAVGLKWYEVAKMWMSDGMFASGPYIFINLKTWNSLPPDIQQLFMDEARTAQAFSIEKDKADTQKNLQFFQNYRQLPDTDTRNMWERQYRILNANMLDTATKQGKEREAKVILNTLDGLVLGK
jgi:TRAP-type C4-dicarboxylate transport system substrate-binding protein